MTSEMNGGAHRPSSANTLVYVHGANITKTAQSVASVFEARATQPDRLPIGSPLRIGKILVPIDFSEPFLNAAATAGALARCFGAQITLVHVQRRSATAKACSEWRTREPSETKTRLHILGKSTVAGLKPTGVVVEGEDIGRAIVELARRDCIDLIVMPTYGNGPFRKLTLGSVTEKVVQAGHCPIWTTPHRTQRVKGISALMEKIVCAVDRDSRARQVLHWARDLALAVGADLTVVHAISEDHRARQSHWSKGRRRDARAALGRRLDELQMRATVHVETGEVTPVVGSAVENLAADLLVIGKRSDVRNCGSIISDSYSLIRNSNCPVVSV